MKFFSARPLLNCRAIGGLIISGVAALVGCSVPSPTPPPPATAGWPDASSTGVPTGTQLTNYTGPMEITTPGTVIDGKIFTDDLRRLTISAPGVVIKNSLFKNEDYWYVDMGDSNPDASVLIQDSEFVGPGSDGVDAAIRGRGWSMQRVNIHGFTIAVKTDGNNSLVDSYLHDFRLFSSEAHADGTMSLGGTSNINIRHNTILFDVTRQATGIVTLSTQYGGNRNVTVDNNYLRGPHATIFYSGLYKLDGITAFAPDESGGPTTSENIRFIDNTIVGEYKEITHYSAWITNHGFEWYGNVRADTGETIPPPETGTLP